MPPRSPRRFRFATAGTRFRVYLQPRELPGFHAPAVVHVRARPGTIRPGPADTRMRVIDARDKPAYKDDRWLKPRTLPPYPEGAPRWPPVRPGRGGHFDHLRASTRAFSAAMVYATVRCVLEVWEHYLGRLRPWFFSPTYRTLQIFPRVASTSAWSGEGFLEFGFPGADRRRDPFSQNFDVVAHEVGHLIMKSVVGNPTDDKKTLEYRAHEEACADLVALMASLHFEPVARHLLEHTRGKLFSVNNLSRMGELAAGGQIRRAFNRETMSTRLVQAAWEGYRPHDYSLPFAGAAFDIFVALYETRLAARDAIPDALVRRARGAPLRDLAAIQRHFARHYALRPGAFLDALLDARDEFCRLLAHTWTRLPVLGLSYGRAAARMMRAAHQVGLAEHVETIAEMFLAREIVPAE